MSPLFGPGSTFGHDIRSLLVAMVVAASGSTILRVILFVSGSVGLFSLEKMLILIL